MIQTSKSKKPKPPEALRIVVVAPDLEVTDPEDDHALSQAKRSRALRIGLLENGFNLIASLPADVFLADRIAQLQPDLIIVDAESEARDALEHVVFATRDARRPIVMFTDDSDTSHVKDAVAVGVSAYIVDGLASSRIKPILDVAMARFEYEERLRQERDQARCARCAVQAGAGDLQARTALDHDGALDRLHPDPQGRGRFQDGAERQRRAVEVAQNPRAVDQRPPQEDVPPLRLPGVQQDHVARRRLDPHIIDRRLPRAQPRPGPAAKSKLMTAALGLICG